MTCNNTVWYTRNGKGLVVHEMDDAHLLNAIHRSSRKYLDEEDLRVDLLVVLVNELILRLPIISDDMARLLDAIERRE